MRKGHKWMTTFLVDDLLFSSSIARLEQHLTPTYQATIVD